MNCSCKPLKRVRTSYTLVILYATVGVLKVYMVSHFHLILIRIVM